MLHKYLYGFYVIYSYIFAHEPPCQTYSSVGQVTFQHSFSVHEPLYASVGLEPMKGPEGLDCAITNLSSLVMLLYCSVCITCLSSHARGM